MCIHLHSTATHRHTFFPDKVHISSVCRAVYAVQCMPCSVCSAAPLELRRIASVLPYLTQSATAQLVLSAITSRLDYYNSILAGLPLKQISRLQRVQNNAAKLVLRKSKYDHVTPLRQELHWLPIKFRTQYKTATFVYAFLTALCQVIFLRLYVHMNQHETFAHRVRSS